ncbi:hypothetical protein [Pontibaca methylaminivorans]|uniref:Formylmethanofuran dehydrogenase subunit E n=1 Tax=Pontibaca methylaminivorans TaxID=515897 RepID=A0A1R3WCT9_9RHOB|nr:hypothetical protein [Pontibaca methylaminivorans]SIT75635.1 hypothetical protein SAMN05421849_0360 [Pontibaca methylaminivorans]
MSFPAFFAAAPTITLQDPLAAFLGIGDGHITYSYGDAVKLAGHSCPTVAGAYLALCQGLRALYGADTPERGAIEVALPEAPDAGVAGVIASVATLLTGAAGETGFGGIGPQRMFSRRDLLRFGVALEGTLGLRRRDSGRGVSVTFDTSAVPPAPQMQRLLPLVLSGRASPGQRAEFGALWQERVAAMLTTHAGDPALVQLRDWPAPG